MEGVCCVMTLKKWSYIIYYSQTHSDKMSVVNAYGAFWKILCFGVHPQLYFVCNRGDAIQYHGGLQSRELGQAPLLQALPSHPRQQVVWLYLLQDRDSINHQPPYNNENQWPSDARRWHFASVIFFVTCKMMEQQETRFLDKIHNQWYFQP